MNDVAALAVRRAPILAKIPPPAQFALTFLVGVGLDRLMPWRPAWMTMQIVQWAGASAYARRLFARRGRGGTVRAPAHDAPSDR